jgi:hypothetical protein
MGDAGKELAVHLKKLMETLEDIGHEHSEIYDTDVREQLFEAVLKGFIKPQAGYALPDTYGLYEAEGNQRVKQALERYIIVASQLAEKAGLNARERLEAFQNLKVHTDGEEQYPDDFFGWLDPEDLKE